MRKLFLRLANSAGVRGFVKGLRLHLLGNWWLSHFPVVKTLPGSSVRYRARRLESLALSVEMFDQGELYPVDALPSRVRSFADLGCNVGYFTCLLCQRTKSTDLKGLMVDANPEATREAQWHVEANGLRDTQVLQGLVGSGTQKTKAEFFVHKRSNVCSTDVLPEGVGSSSHWSSVDDWEKISVPCLSIEQNWQKRFGNENCDLLKLDIEGSELEFFQNETEFMRRVQSILLEWHKQRVTLDQVKSLLGNQGFSLKSVLHEDEGAGVATFVRGTSLANS
jgi:FkbM family methyltransferase